MKFFDYCPEDANKRSFASLLTISKINSLKHKGDPKAPPTLKLLGAPPAPSSSSTPPTASLDLEFLRNCFKDLDSTVVASTKYLGEIFTKLCDFQTDHIGNIEKMIGTLYGCHRNLLRAFKDMIKFNTKFPDALAKKIIEKSNPEEEVFEEREESSKKVGDNDHNTGVEKKEEKEEEKKDEESVVETFPEKKEEVNTASQIASVLQEIQEQNPAT